MVRVKSDPFYLPSQVGAAFSNEDVLEVEVLRSRFEPGVHDALFSSLGVGDIKTGRVHGGVDEDFAR